MKGTTLLQDGRILSAPPGRSNPGSHRFYLLDREGTVIKPIGPISSSNKSLAHEAGGIVHFVGGHQFWVASPSRYRLELWDTAGSRIRVLERTVDWFKQTRSADAVEASPSLLPLQLVSLRSDAAGLVWTTASLPQSRAVEDRQDLFGLKDPDRYYDWRIEVLDTGSGDLVASELYDRMRDVPIFSPLGLAYRFSQDVSGGTYIQIVDVMLRPADR